MNNIVRFVCTLGRTAMPGIKRCWRGVKNNLDAIGVLLIIASPVCQLFCTSVRSSIITNVLIIWLGLILIAVDKGIHNKQYGIPVMRKPFVHYNKANDSVYINEDDWNEVVSYLADLQEYFEGGGML